MRALLFLFTAAVACAQAPRIGTIDFYGLRSVSAARLRQTLGVKEGDPLPPSKGDTEESLEKVDGVVRARLEAICCNEAGDAILYTGIEERGAPHFDYLPPPDGDAVLPDEIHDEYVAFLASIGIAVRAGETEEDLSEGHSLMSNPIARKHQQAFLEFAKDHLDELRTVLKESNDDEQRAIAAYVIGYVPKTNPKVVQLVVDDLQRSLRDPDDTVRNNTFRSLGAIAVLAAKRPYFGIRVSPTWLIEMLGSLVWEDRVAATGILLTLTEGRDKDLLERLRERSHTLAEMAGWKHLPHALPAFMLLGRVAGNGDAVIQKRWETDRTEAIREWTAGLGQQAK